MNRIKEVMMRRIWKVPVYLIVVLLGASIATAAVVYSLRIPSSITILPSPGTYEVKIYEDEACSTQATSFDFGSVALGKNSSVHFYIKSLSNVPAEVRVYVDPHISYVGLYLNDKQTDTITHSWFGGPLQPDEVREITLTLIVGVEAQTGTRNFDLLFEVYPSA